MPWGQGMAVRLPTPINGWRVFWGEVGIIVLGVLIALGAQQVVEAIQWKREVAGFRAAVREEMENNLHSYPYRAKQERCMHQRLDELQRWVDGWRAGRGVKLAGPIGIPASRVVRTNIWDSTDPATLAHVPRAERAEYSFLYSEFLNNEVHRLDERDAWMEMAAYERADFLDHQDQIRLQGLIARARLRDERIRSNSNRFIKRAAENMGLYPRPVPSPPAYDPRLCVSILPAAAAR